MNSQISSPWYPAYTKTLQDWCKLKIENSILKADIKFLSQMLVKYCNDEHILYETARILNKHLQEELCK